MARRAVRVASWVFAIAMLVGTWFLISVIEDASWGAGDRRALVTVALLVLTMTFAAIAGRTRRRTGSTRPAIGLVAAILVGAACLPALRTQVELGVTRFKAPHLNDIPLTTMAAARVMASGRNPYSTPVDPRAESAEQGRNYDGFKYLPMMAVAFAPAALLDSARGVIVINACLHIATAVLIFAAARILAGSLAASFGLILYLWLSLVPRQMFTPGVTDYAAVVPLLVAFLVTDRRAWLAGLLVGLSLSAKLVPAAAVAAIIAPAAPPWRPGPGRRYWSGFICGCLPSLAYLLWAPGDLISNVLLFNLSRPADSTSWLFEHPNWWRTAATVGLAALFSSVALVRWGAKPDLRGRALLIVVVTMGTTLLGPVDHGNYQLWWIPWLSILFASSVGPFLVVKT
ncbi:MAG: hypothetical protein NTV05_03130 [Acidobacteria bacterium]|nr:hypothetical protein [Acidobacteriota bacterium]